MSGKKPQFQIVNGTRSPAEQARQAGENVLAGLHDLIAFADAVLDGPARGLRNTELKEAMRIVRNYAGSIQGYAKVAWHEGELDRRERAAARAEDEGA